jgi:hypothetical protein
MGRLVGIAGVMLSVLAVYGSAYCQEQPEKVTVCQLKNAPPTYNHKLIEVTAFVSRDFEDFTLFDPTCPLWPDVWLEYGDTEELEVENFPITLTVNDEFQRFDELIQTPFGSERHGSIVHAMIVGRFFAGKRDRFAKGSWWGGFGHMGCCTLLAIQEIKSVDPQDRDDLDYGASPDQPNTDKCGYRGLTPPGPTVEPIEAQQRAETGKENWAFEDPERVAADALGRLAAVKEPITGIEEKRKTQGRIVYEWRAAKTRAKYMVVVNRPYWLSFYARDPKRVAWVVAAAYEICSD